MTDQLPDLDNECFFITPIGAEGSPERDRSDGILEFIVQEAASQLDLTAIRADQIAQPGQITLQVLEHVLGARAAVADLTGLNPNVFYELAVRHTARLPVVLIVDKGESLPFDIAQMRTVFFDHTDLRSATVCRKAIVSQLKEAFAGAVDSPIATTVDVKALQGGNTVERNIAELVQSLEQLSQMQRRMFDVVYDLRSTSPTRSSVDLHAMHAIEAAFHQLRELEDLANERQDDELARQLLEILVPLEYAGDVLRHRHSVDERDVLLARSVSPRSSEGDRQPGVSDSRREELLAARRAVRDAERARRMAASPASKVSKKKSE